MLCIRESVKAIPSSPENPLDYLSAGDFCRVGFIVLWRSLCVASAQSATLVMAIVTTPKRNLNQGMRFGRVLGGHHDDVISR